MADITKWTFQKVSIESLKKFLEQLAEHGQLRTAAQAVGIPHITVKQYLEAGLALSSNEERIQHYKSHALNDERYSHDDLWDAVLDPTHSLLTALERVELIQLWFAAETERVLGFYKTDLLKVIHTAAKSDVIYDKEGSAVAKQHEVKSKIAWKLLEQTDTDEFGESKVQDNDPHHIVIEKFIQNNGKVNVQLGARATLGEISRETGEVSAIQIDEDGGTPLFEVTPKEPEPSETK